MSSKKSITQFFDATPGVSKTWVAPKAGVYNITATSPGGGGAAGDGARGGGAGSGGMSGAVDVYLEAGEVVTYSLYDGGLGGATAGAAGITATAVTVFVGPSALFNLTPGNGAAATGAGGVAAGADGYANAVGVVKAGSAGNANSTVLGGTQGQSRAKGSKLSTQTADGATGVPGVSYGYGGSGGGRNGLGGKGGAGAIWISLP